MHGETFLAGAAWLGLCRLLAAASLRVPWFPPCIVQDAAKDHRNGECSGLRRPSLKLSQESAQESPARWRTLLLEGAAGVALLGIPPGPLPALTGGAGVVCALGGLLLGGALFPPALRRRALCAVLLLLGAAGVCAVVARGAGVPGDLWTLDAYVGLPLGAVARGWAWAGVLLAGLGSLWGLWRAADVCPASARGAVARRLWFWAALGVWVALFWPGGLASVASLPVLPGLALDVSYFFLKLYSLSLILTWTRRR